MAMLCRLNEGVQSVCPALSEGMITITSSRQARVLSKDRECLSISETPVPFLAQEKSVV